MIYIILFYEALVCLLYLLVVEVYGLNLLR